MSNKYDNKINESVPVDVCVLFASLGTAVFAILNAKLVTDLVLKYGKKVIGALSKLEQNRNKVKNAKSNKIEKDNIIAITRKQLTDSGMDVKEVELVLEATFGKDWKK